MTSSKGGRRLVTVLGALLLAACVAPSAVAAPPWSEPTAISPGGYLWFTPGAAVGEDGYAVVTWTGGPREPRRTMRPWLAARLPGEQAFEPRRSIGPRRSEVFGPYLAEDEGTSFHAVWRRGRLLRIREHSADGTLGPPERIGPRRVLGFAFDVAPDGSAVVAWRVKPGLRASLRPPGGDFGPPVRFVDERRLSYGVAAAPNGGAAVIWQRYSSGADRRGYAAIRRPGGATFGQPRRLPRTGRLQLGASAINDDGEVVVMSEDHTELIAVAASVKPAVGPFGSPANLGKGFFNLFPFVRADASGRFVASWDRLGRGFGNFGPQVASYNDGAGWSSPVTASPRGMSMSSFDLSPAGTIGIGISDVRRRRQVLRASIQPPGEPMSKAERITVDQTLDELVTPWVAVDDDGGALATWGTSIFAPGRVLVSSRDPALASAAVPPAGATTSGSEPAPSADTLRREIRHRQAARYPEQHPRNLAARALRR